MRINIYAVTKTVLDDSGIVQQAVSTRTVFLSKQQAELELVRLRSSIARVEVIPFHLEFNLFKLIYKVIYLRFLILGLVAALVKTYSGLSSSVLVIIAYHTIIGLIILGVLVWPILCSLTKSIRQQIQDRWQTHKPPV